jgi:hypothetical protein
MPLLNNKDNTRSHLQRAQAVHGDEPEAVRRVLAKVQGRATARKGASTRTRRAVEQNRACGQKEPQSKKYATEHLDAHTVH